MSQYIRELIDELNYHTKLYNEGKEEISDKEWDDLYFTLKKEEENSGIIYPDSPTQKIKYELISKLNKVKHDHLMLSLDKSKDINDIEAFLNKQPFIAMFKMDGLTCSLTYEDGKLVKAETRGDGEIGEDILHNAKVVKNIPLTIPTDKKKVVIDGEVICRKDDFVPFSNAYKNPRNFASGSIRLLSSEECQKRNLSFVAWELIEGYPQIEDFWIKLMQLQILGFTVVPFVTSAKTVEEAIKIFNTGFQDLKNIYPIDGYVFKFKDIKYGEAQGQTDHHFKNAIAYKFYDDLYETRLRTIHWSMGRTGVLTPVAIFDPVEIDGTTIERASLHNVSVMRDILGDCAYDGEPLKIAKMNQIIPQIIEAGPKFDYAYVVSHGGCSANDVPEFCPICTHPIDYITSKDGVINAYCSNPQCDGKLLNKLNHFAGKKGLDIKGLSKATFEKLIDWGWLDNIIDLFYLSQHRKEWIDKPGFGITSVDKILKSIDEHRNTTLESFICAAGIPLIGPVAARDIANKFETYKKFRVAVDNERYFFSEIDGIGEEMNWCIKDFDYSEMDKIAELLFFSNPEYENAQSENIISALEGKNIVITGKLINFKNRDSFKRLIIQCGGKVSDTITNKTNILINNDINSTSSKNKKAKDLNIPILSEEEFLAQYNIDFCKLL